MDAKMKGMILSGMMALCLILGLLATLGGTWLEEDMDKDAKAMGQDGTYGLNTYYMEWDMTEMSDDVTDDDCEDMVDSMLDDDEGPDGMTGECDGTTAMMTVPLSSLCDTYTDAHEEAEDLGADDDTLDEMKEEADEACDGASAGTMGTIGMWGGVVCALLAVLILVLPMAGVDALDAVPDMAKTIVSWAAGGLMLLGILLWYMMLPDGDASAGMSLWMAVGAAVLGLGASAMDQFMPADE